MPAYATLTELKSFVGIPDADTADDALLTVALDAASALVESHTGRSFTVPTGVATRIYTATDTAALDVDDVANTTDLAVLTDDNEDSVYETSWVLGTDFVLEPLNSLTNPKSRLVAVGSKLFPRNYRGVSVTANYGWSAVPAAVKHATLLQASRLWKRKDAPFGVAGSVEFGSELRLLSALDPDVQVLLGPYRKSWLFV